MKVAPLHPFWVLPLFCTIAVGLTLIETVGSWQVALSAIFTAAFFALTIYTYILFASGKTIWNEEE